MSIARFLGRATGSRRDRRKSPRNSCRLTCTMHRSRKRIRARVLNVSEGGLCLLSPLRLEKKESLVLEIDAPHGPVSVEARVWHVRQLKGGLAGRKTWSIGLMLTRAGDGFQTLLPASRRSTPSDAALASQEELSAILDDLSLESEELSPEWEERALEWEKLFEESEMLLSESGESPYADLQVFRVRVKAKSGPRSRTLTLSAASEAEAEELARKDLEESWIVLEVVAD